MKKRWISVLVLIFVLIFIQCGKGPANTKYTDKIILRAIDSWVDPKEFDSCITGMLLCMDAIILISPRTGFSDDFKNKISTANKLFESTSVLNKDAYALLLESYRMIHGGEDFQLSQEIDQMRDCLEYSVEQAQVAREFLAEEDFENCVRILLNIVILQVTPVSLKAL